MSTDDPLGEFYLLRSEEVLSDIHGITTFLGKSSCRRKLWRMGWERLEILERVRVFMSDDSEVLQESGGHRTSLVGDLLVEEEVVWRYVPVVRSELNKGVLGELLSQPNTGELERGIDMM